MISLQVYRDANGSLLTNIIAPSDNVNHLILPTANNEKTITVPADSNYAIFHSFNEFFVNIDDTAAVPSADVTDGSGSIPVPVGLFVKPTQVIHVVSSEASARVSVMFFRR